MLDLLVHASQCRSPQCQYPNCRKVKGLFRHGIQCKIRASGGCVLCKKMWYLLQIHSRACKESDCGVPRCRYFIYSIYCILLDYFKMLFLLPPWKTDLKFYFLFLQRSERTFEKVAAAIWFPAEGCSHGDDETACCWGCCEYQLAKCTERVLLAKDWRETSLHTPHIHTIWIHSQRWFNRSKWGWWISGMTWPNW